MDDSNVKNNNQEILPKKLTGNSLSYYFCEIDWTLSRVLSFVFDFLILLSLMFLSLLIIGFELKEIFEYEGGLSDISTVEIVFIISTIVLLKRYRDCCKQTSINWKDMLTVPILYYGKFIAIASIIISSLAIYDLKEGTTYFNILFIYGQNYIQLLSFIFILLGLYISTPSKKLKIKKDVIPHCKNTKEIIPPEPNKTETENA